MSEGKDRSAWDRAVGIFWRAAPWVGLVAMTELWRRSHQRVRGRLSVDAIATPEAFAAAEPRRGRTARGPHAIPPLGWKDIAWRTYQEIGRDRLPSVAGGVTFYTLLALFPAMGVFVSLYGLIADVGAVQAQLDSMASVFPAEVINIVGEQMLRLASRPSATLSAAFVVSLLLSVWSANAGMKALFDGLNIAYDEEEKRNYFTRIALTYVFTFGALLFLVVMCAVLVAAPIVFEALGLEELALVWIPLRWLILLAMAAGAFGVIYRHAPCRARARWRWVSVGAVLAAVFWLVGSLGFSWYLNNIAHYDVTYGSLGAVVAFMTWIWFSVMVVLVGAEINAEIEHQTALDTTIGPARPMGERGAAMADSVGLAFHLDISKIKDKAVSDSLRQAERVRSALRR
ncbi:YihY/virulence factor BrkB family protein [Phenylobacterium sp.]|uniref:YihY/virulence factor BrkB family protein n=1 Tax=Phenylobacterium sp. TaxID=1871053 RepID=UPI0028A2AD8F|nr:YihY/virulence factor BrkB family protein [Phenylobacterium sp.]